MTENYRGCYEYLSAQFPQVGGYEFYKVRRMEIT